MLKRQSGEPISYKIENNPLNMTFSGKFPIFFVKSLTFNDL